MSEEDVRLRETSSDGDEARLGREKRPGVAVLLHRKGERDVTLDKPSRAASRKGRKEIGVPDPPEKVKDGDRLGNVEPARRGFGGVEGRDGNALDEDVHLTDSRSRRREAGTPS